MVLCIYYCVFFWGGGEGEIIILSDDTPKHAWWEVYYCCGIWAYHWRDVYSCIFISILLISFMICYSYIFFLNLDRLSVIILKDREAAVRASILFCFNPASIFYSSMYSSFASPFISGQILTCWNWLQIAFTVCSYSESLYALLSFEGLYHLMSGANNFAVLWFALSGSARSNGVLNAGYIGFQTMHRAYDAIFRKKHPIVSSII